MNAIDLLRLVAIDKMDEPQASAQLNTIFGLTNTATPDDLRSFEMYLLFYRGVHKNALKEALDLRKASYSSAKYQQHKIGKLFEKNSKSILNLKKTDGRENKLSLWKLLRFWESSQQGQQRPQIQNKQCQISSSIKHLQQKTPQQIPQQKNQQQPAKKLIQGHYRCQEPTLDVLVQEQQQSLLCGPMDSVEYLDGQHSMAKQTKTWLYQKSVRPKQKGD